MHGIESLWPFAPRQIHPTAGSGEAFFGVFVIVNYTYALRSVNYGASDAFDAFDASDASDALSPFVVGKSSTETLRSSGKCSSDFPRLSQSDKLTGFKQGGPTDVLYATMISASANFSHANALAQSDPKRSKNSIHSIRT